MKRKIFENLVGKKFGILMVEAFDKRYKYRDYWRCRCFCGNYIHRTHNELKKIKSCGCHKFPLFKIGDTFGLLTIIGDFVYDNKDHSHRRAGQYKYPCRCKCGIELLITDAYLRTNTKNKSCGCYKFRRSKSKSVFKIGERFGDFILERKEKNKWRCRCNCGNIKYFSEGRLYNVSNCGCLSLQKKIKDMLGKNFGMLTVIAYDGKKKQTSNMHWWQCMCQCGKTTTIPTNKLGITQSCGCLWRKKIVKHGLYGKPGYMKYLLQDPIRKLKHHISCSIRWSLKSRNGVKGGKTFEALPYTVEELKSHIESLWEPWMNWDNYGGCLNCKKRTWHIDHIICHNKFKYKTLNEPDFISCWALDNLRPLEKHENARRKRK